MVVILTLDVITIEIRNIEFPHNFLVFGNVAEKSTINTVSNKSKANI